MLWPVCKNCILLQMALGNLATPIWETVGCLERHFESCLQQILGDCLGENLGESLGDHLEGRLGDHLVGHCPWSHHSRSHPLCWKLNERMQNNHDTDSLVCPVRMVCDCNHLLTQGNPSGLLQMRSAKQEPELHKSLLDDNSNLSLLLPAKGED